jgi:hypothetical protein
MPHDDAPPDPGPGWDQLFSEAPTEKDRLIEELQQEIVREKDARNEDRFFFIVVCIILFNIMIFTVMPNVGGPIAVLILELLVLIPLAKRMGMQEIATNLDRVLTRMSGRGG